MLFTNFKKSERIIKYIIYIMNNQQKITAMIGVRKNSVRVKNKNIKQFYDTTLLDLKIKTLLHLNQN